jgi:hypothetical protein
VTFFDWRYVVDAHGRLEKRVESGTRNAAGNEPRPLDADRKVGRTADTAIILDQSH